MSPGPLSDTWERGNPYERYIGRWSFVPDQPAALAEMARVTGKGGTIAGYVWDYAGKMELIRFFWDAAVELDPNAAKLDEGARFPLCRPDALEKLFTGARLRHVAG